MPTNLPQPLIDLVANWRAQGAPDQPGIAWPQAKWCDDFPEHRETLQQLPRLLDRNAVRAVSASASHSPESALTAFVVSMAWGFGGVGYGRHRVAKMLSDPDAAARFQAAAVSVNSEGALSAYRQMSAPANRIKFLGPAFATKFLAFCSLNEARPALIFDRLVAAWLTKHEGGRWNAIAWSESVYGRYLELVYAWARQLDARPDEVERLMFSHEARMLGNQWAGQ